MTTRINGAIYQGYWFTKDDVMVLPIDLSEDMSATASADGGHGTDTELAATLRALSTACTILWWAMTGTTSIMVMIEGFPISYDVDGTISAGIYF